MVDVVGNGVDVVVMCWHSLRCGLATVFEGRTTRPPALAELRPHSARLSVDEARRLPAFRSAGEMLELRRGQGLVLLEAREAGVKPRSWKEDPGELRGIPVVGLGVGGVSPGTKPGSDASLKRCDEREWRAA